MYSKGMFNAYQVVHRKEWWRVISHAFLHSGPWHLGVNMFVLWSFGSNLEQLWNSPEIFAYYLGEGFRSPQGYEGYVWWLILYFGGAVAATVPAMIKHKDNPGYNSVGASGGVSSVLLASIVIFPTKNINLFLGIPVIAWLAGILFFWYESYMNKRKVGNVAHDAHLAGAVFGLLFMLVLNPNYLFRAGKLIYAQFAGWRGFL